jgi:hypothetical protein
MDVVFYDSRDRKIEDGIFSLSDKTEISIYFEVPKWIKRGYKLAVNANNFILCNGKQLEIPLLEIDIEDLIVN